MINERADLSALEGETFDLAVVGGGIMGTGIARDASLRGLRVLLVEKEDFGSGTSSRTSRLIHGGLRYLAHLDFKIVRDDLRERTRLLRNAPHLVSPLPCLIPIYGHGVLDRIILRAGLVIYDLLAWGSGLPRHKWLGCNEILDSEPGLNPKGLRGGFLFYDAQAPRVERLCLENALDAVGNGAALVNYTSAIGLIREKGRVVGLEVEDVATTKRHQISARLVVNAAGPWAGLLRDLAGEKSAPMVRTTRGVHVIVNKSCSNGIVLTARTDGRIFFVLPWLGYSLIGTTDVDYSGDPEHIQPDTEDVSYLMDEVKRFFPSLGDNNVLGTYAGLRTLSDSHRGKESDASRRPKIIDHSVEGVPGLISIVGGKLTAYRQISQAATDLACSLLDVQRMCLTLDRPLPGFLGTELSSLLDGSRELADSYGISKASGEYLAQLYGNRYREVLAMAGENPRGRAVLCPHTPAIVAQVRHAVNHEWARTPADFLLRRTLLGLTPPCFGLDALSIVIDEMGRCLGWSAEDKCKQKNTYLSNVNHGGWLQVRNGPKISTDD